MGISRGWLNRIGGGWSVAALLLWPGQAGAQTGLSVASVTATGSAQSWSYTMTVQDNAGAGAVSAAEFFLTSGGVLGSANVGYSNSCHVTYLKNPAGSYFPEGLYQYDTEGQWNVIGDQPLGGAWQGSYYNSVCRVDGWTVSKAGNTLTLNVALTFLQAGSWYASAYAEDTGARSTGWQTAWGGAAVAVTVPAITGPFLTALTVIGGGETREFVLTVQDNAGAGTVDVAEVFLSSGGVLGTYNAATGGAFGYGNSCHVEYWRGPVEAVYLDSADGLWDWAGYQPLGTASAPGGPWVGSNSNGVCRMEAWTLARNGNTLTLDFIVTFLEPGTWYGVAWARDTAGYDSTWQATWAGANVTAAVVADPVPEPVWLGTGGSGATRSFSLLVENFAGSPPVQVMQVFLATGTSLGGGGNNLSLNANSCHVEYWQGAFYLDGSAGLWEFVASQQAGQAWSGPNSNGVCRVESWSVRAVDAVTTELDFTVTFLETGTWYPLSQAYSAAGYSNWLIGSSGLTVGVPGVQVTTATVPGGTVGTAYLANLTAGGGTSGGYAWSVTAGALPPGVALSTAGVLSGTPTAAGMYSFTVTARDSAGSTGWMALKMAVVVPVSISTKAVANGTVGLLYAASPALVAAGGGGAPWTWSAPSTGAGVLPSGMTLSAAGVLGGTPTAAGTFSFTATAMDSAGNLGSGSVTITVATGMPTAVVTLSAGVGAGAFNVPFTQAIQATGGSRWA